MCSVSASACSPLTPDDWEDCGWKAWGQQKNERSSGDLPPSGKALSVQGCITTSRQPVDDCMPAVHDAWPTALYHSNAHTCSRMLMWRYTGCSVV